MITLELLASGSGSVEADVVNHVHRRVEKFIYADDVDAAAVPLDYMESPEFVPSRNLRYANRTGTVFQNRHQFLENKTGYERFYGDTWNSPYWDIAATNVTVVDEAGQVKPLFWKHKLPVGTVEASIEVVTRGNRTIVDSGYLLDLEAGYIFTNYHNFFDPETGAYRLYYVVSAIGDGTSTHTLLASEPAAHEAGWQDIDLGTGNLYETYPLFTKERGTGDNTFTFNVVDHWYVRPLSRALIQPLKPMALGADRPWFIRFTNGEFHANTNGSLRRYYVPEYEHQAFNPTRPYIFSSYERLERVSDSVLKAPRSDIAVLPGMFMTILVRDYDGRLLKVLTTDASLAGTRYGVEPVYYEHGLVAAVDNAGGFISLGIKILPGWDVSASYFYTATDYEYTAIDLNPVSNKHVRCRMVVFYLVPDVADPENEKAIHHLVVDHDGMIVEASQPELQLRNPAVNPSTVIGTQYSDFVDTYCVDGANSYGYALLVEVGVDAAGDARDMIVYDARRSGAAPASTEVVGKQPQLLHSVIMGNPDGMTIPRDGVVVIEIPLSVLRDYGGVLTVEQAEKLALKHLDTSVYPVVQWVYPAPELTGTQTAVGEAELTWTWEGPGDYCLYRKSTQASAWELVDTVTVAAEPLNRVSTYVDTGLTQGIYYYGVSFADGAEYPIPNSVAIEV